MYWFVIFWIVWFSMLMGWASYKAFPPIKPLKSARRARLEVPLRALPFLGVLLFLYVHGSFDEPLAPLGLNFNSCGHTKGTDIYICGREWAIIEEARRETQETLGHGEEG